MSRLPASPDLDHLRKQAKRLLRAFRAGDGAAIARFRSSLPAAQDRPAAFVAAQPYRLHDAQSVIAREHGFRSWLELKRHVDWCRSSEAERRARWLELVFSERARERALSLRMLEAEPGLALGAPGSPVSPAIPAGWRRRSTRTPISPIGRQARTRCRRLPSSRIPN